MRTSIFFCLVLMLFVHVGQAENEIRWNRPLQESLAGVDRVRVRSGGTCHRKPEKERTLFETREDEEIAGLLTAIEVVEEQNLVGMCCCCGQPTIEIYRGETLVVSLGIHHALSLRWADGKWPGDGKLTAASRTRLCVWLARNGVPGPAKELEEWNHREKEEEESRKQWADAMPSSLSPFRNALLTAAEPPKTNVLAEALAKEYPDSKPRIRALFRWFGSAMAWPIHGRHYHRSTFDLLQAQGSKEILHALETETLQDSEIAGAARYFYVQREESPSALEIQQVGEVWKSRFFDLGLRTQDENLHHRIRIFFGRPEDLPIEPDDPFR